MLRGFLSGGAWGVIVAAVGLVTASLLAPQPAGNAPPSEPQVAISDAAGSDVQAQTPDVDAQVAAQPEPDRQIVVTGPQTAMPAAQSDALIADTTPASPPVIATDSTGLTVPAETDAPTLALAPETPVLPNPQAAAPATPAPEADLVLSTTPAAPPVPVVVPAPAEVPEPVIVIPVEPAVVPEVVPEVVLEPVIEIEPAPAVEPAPATVVEPEPAPAIEPEPAPVVDPEPEAAVEPESVVVPEPVIEPEPEPAPVPDLPAETAPAAVEPETPAIIAPQTPTAPPVVADAATLPADPPSVEPQPAAPPPPARIVMQGDAASLPQVNSGVQVNRPEEAPAAAETLLPGATDDADPGLSTLPAMDRFAAAFENPDAKPLLSIILIDDGAIAGMTAALAGVPFPVTVAIDPAGPDAAARMEGYRAAGIEVLAIARVPQGAQPSDVEVVLESVFRTLPQALGLLDLEEGSLQSSAAVTGQAMARLAADGRGLVVTGTGLNPGLRAAVTAEVPAGEVYRDLDGDGQDARTIRRFLDNAAFQARQQSGIILLARLQPETISALILWGTENRAGQVALAPISAVLGQ